MTFSLPPACKALVFDASGTLFDVHSAVMRHKDAIGQDAAAFSALWRNKQLECSWVLSLAGRYADFWVLTQRALDYALAAYPKVDAGLRPTLLKAYRRLDAYPEVPGTLDLLRKRGLKTAILSNGEPEMLSDAVSSAGIAALLDHVFSVSAVSVFKTHPDAYAQVPKPLGVGPGEIVFVSSNRWDVAGAAAFGFMPVWVNRLGAPDEYPGLAPIAVVGGLDQLAG